MGNGQRKGLDEDASEEFLMAFLLGWGFPLPSDTLSKVLCVNTSQSTVIFDRTG